MISVVCNSALNRSVREYQLKQPAEILNESRKMVIFEFQKSTEDVKDGMGIALYSIQENILEFAGANNPLWVFRKEAFDLNDVLTNLKYAIYENEQSNLLEIKGNKQPMGRFEKAQSFQNAKIKLEKGDMIYLFSDGYVDQFGGGHEGNVLGKKFKIKALRKLLFQINSKPLSIQKETLEKGFDAWKGDLEQIDDVCIMGIRV